MFWGKIKGREGQRNEGTKEGGFPVCHIELFLVPQATSQNSVMETGGSLKGGEERMLVKGWGRRPWV